MTIEFLMRFGFRSERSVSGYVSKRENQRQQKLLIIYCFDAGKSFTLKEFE
jgi:hypothetical protein